MQHAVGRKGLQYVRVWVWVCWDIAHPGGDTGYITCFWTLQHFLSDQLSIRSFSRPNCPQTWGCRQRVYCIGGGKRPQAVGNVKAG